VPGVAVTDVDAPTVALAPADDTTADDGDSGEVDAEPSGSSADEPELEPADARPADAEPAVPDRPSTARKGRPTVPSWDDIMFGRRPGRT
jgi:hypothetical protein